MIDATIFSVSVIVPTRNGGDVWRQTLRAILSQTTPSKLELIVVDSESSDGTADATERLCGDRSINSRDIPLTHMRIDAHSFGHGRTRNLAAGMATGDILVFLSQDATPVGNNWLTALLQPFADRRVAGVYCRQEPRPGTTAPEQYNLAAAFPRQGKVLSRASIGTVSVLFSNAASAMRRQIWRDRPFDETLMMCEDQYWALQVLEAGFTIVYNANACVTHSHSYALRTLVSRYFDSGVALPAALRGAGQRTYWRYLMGEVGYVTRNGGLGALPWLGAYEVGRIAGYSLGLHHQRVPLWLSRRVSGYPRWFDAPRSGPTRGGRARADRTCFMVCNSANAGARVRREAKVIAGLMPTTVLAVPGPISALGSDAAGAQMMLGMPIERLERITLRRQENFRVLLMPWPGKPLSATRGKGDGGDGEAGPQIQALGAITSLLKINARLAILGTYQRAAVYHAHDLDTLPAAAFAARVNRAKLIYDAHELWPDMSPSRARWLMWTALERLLIRRADMVMTINQSIADELMRRYHVPCTVIHNFPSGQAGAAPTTPWRPSLALPPESVVVRYHGLFLPDRGMEELVKAIPLLDPRVLVTFQGYGPLEDELRRLAAQLNVIDRVRFLGPLPAASMVSAASEADIGVHFIRETNANHRLCSPNKVYEYLHAGLALVVSNLPELRAIIDDTGAGLVCDPDVVQSIADSINYFVNDPRALTRAREASLSAAPRYSWERVAAELVRVYECLGHDDKHGLARDIRSRPNDATIGERVP